jgi:C1A family cysteine protease
MPRYYGWRGPSLPDLRDYHYAAPANILKILPQSVDLRPQCPPVLDQLQLGSCVSNAVAGVLQFLQMKEGISAFVASRLFIYYNGRTLENTINSDSGLSVRDGLRSVLRYGFPPESDWPYNIIQFTQQPPSQVYQDARPNQIWEYYSVPQLLTNMQACLASGFPILLGFSVYQSFESYTVAQTGVVPMPSPGEQLLGGHCVYLVGYDSSKQWFIFRNSWSDQWGDKGNGYLSFGYVLNPQLASDFWTIRSVS